MHSHLHVSTTSFQFRMAETPAVSFKVYRAIFNAETVVLKMSSQVQRPSFPFKVAGNSFQHFSATITSWLLVSHKCPIIGEQVVVMFRASIARSLKKYVTSRLRVTSYISENLRWL